MYRLASACAALLLVTPVFAQPDPSSEEGAPTTAQEEPGSEAQPAKKSKSARTPRKAETTGEEPSDEAPGDKTFSHFFQFGLRASVLAGYRTVFRYDDSPFCKAPEPSKGLKDQQKFCGHMGPAMIDLAASFAPLGPIEPFAFARFGLVGESATDTKPLKMVGLGVRIYTRSSSALKIFVEPSIGLELEKGYGSSNFQFQGFNPEYKQDIIFRAAVGPHWDVHRNVGVYAQVFGMSVGVLRSIHSTVEFGAGVQVRLP